MGPGIATAKRMVKPLILRTVGPTIIGGDFRRARERILKGQTLVKTPTHGVHEVEALTAEEKKLIEDVSLAVGAFDSMYVLGQADHYLLVGLSAVRCIRAAMASAGVKAESVKAVLDFPVGWGRVLRFLKAAFPGARVSGAEIDAPALEFCVREFSLEAVTAPMDFSWISPEKKFDLIWCGSLVTHLKEKPTMALLRMFREHLTEGGICVFSAHGPAAAKLVREEKCDYGLSLREREKMLAEYEQMGYGYGDYPDGAGYGISLESPERVRKMISELGRCVFYQEMGWDRHHDVYGFQR
ncbi:MAG: class I SAM-dependent methyltransferase [Candidatus Sulfotelmatobacter sp.]